MYKFLITSMNIDIICHKQELRLIISRMKPGKGELVNEGGRGRKGV